MKLVADHHNHDSSSSCSCFSLCVEVDRSHRQSEAAFLGEASRVEVVSRSRRHAHRSPPFLLEEDEHVPVDADGRLRCLVANYLSTCIVHTNRHFITCINHEKMSIGRTCSSPTTHQTMH